jgi:hypothetical protein
MTQPRTKRVNLSNLAPLTPDFSTGTPDSIVVIQAREIERLAKKVAAMQEHVGKLKYALAFVKEPLAPLKPMQTRRPARKGRGL